MGVKSRILNNRGSLNVAAFYADINDLQATQTAGSCSSRVILNVPKSRSQGIEAELAAAPNKNFDFAISGSYNDSTLRSTFSSAGGDLGHPWRAPACRACPSSRCRPRRPTSGR